MQIIVSFSPKRFLYHSSSDCSAENDRENMNEKKKTEKIRLIVLKNCDSKLFP